MARPMTLILAAVGLLGSLGLAGCGGGEPQPSSEAFCATLQENRATVDDAREAVRSITEAGDNLQGVGAAADVAATFIDTTRVIDQLTQVAPPEIRTDMEALRDAADQVAFPESMTPQGVYAEAVQAKEQLEAGNHLENLASYTRDQCGVELTVF